MPTILYIIPNGALGGAEIATLGMMAHHQHYKAVAVFLRVGPMLDACREHGIQTELVKTHMRLRNPFSILKLNKEIAKLGRTHKAVAIHNCMSYAQIASFLAAKWLGIPTFLFHHGPFGNRLDQLASHLGAPHILTNSQHMRRQIAEKGCGKAVRIPLGPVDLKRGQSRLSYEKAEGEITIVSAARLDPNKGQHIAIHALSLLKNHPHTKLLIVGAGLPNLHDSYAEKLRNKAEALGLSDRVVFTGMIEDMSSVYAVADIFLHTSFQEAHGLSILEAMQHSVPVVAAKVGGVPELITQAENGLLFTKGNAEHCADALDRLISDPALAQRYSENALELVNSTYSAASSSRALEEIYRNTLS